MKTLYFLTFLIITLAPLKVSAQNFSHMEVYDSDFVFSDGVYLTKDDFIKNHPIDKSRINSEFNSDDLNSVITTVWVAKSQSMLPLFSDIALTERCMLITTIFFQG